MLVVEARDIGRGRLLAVESDVLDRALEVGVAILMVLVSLRGSASERSALRFMITNSSTNCVRKTQRRIGRDAESADLDRRPSMAFPRPIAKAKRQTTRKFWPQDRTMMGCPLVWRGGWDVED